jgi:cytochrome c peroxidase
LFAFGHVDHALSHGINGLIGTRNVPALQNLAWSTTLMWDGGVNHLELQPLAPMLNPREMGETVAGILHKLNRHPVYAAEFKAAFGDTITSQNMLRALAVFTGLMVSDNSRYDSYLQGRDTFSKQEERGLNLFRAKCASCHTEPLFTNNGYASNGILADTSLNDLGRGRITGVDSDNYKFKIPSLRNAERTYPYLHDGRMRNLHAVLDHYGNPAHFGPTADARLKVIGTLTDDDKQALIAFICTLTDLKFIYDRRFIDPFMDQR